MTARPLLRITGNCTTNEVLYNMSGGNPGALSVLMKLITKGPEIDTADGGGIYILGLDTMRIYDERIWMLYKDLCGQSLTHTMAAMAAVALDLITLDQLNDAIDSKTTLDVGSLVDQVVTLLPDFKPASEAS